MTRKKNEKDGTEAVGEESAFSINKGDGSLAELDDAVFEFVSCKT
jgi:hypothetical protein